MADNPSEKKISETSGVKAVLDEAAERIEATWREKLLRETADLRTENALLMAQVDEFSRKLAEVTDRNEKIEADCNERVAFIEAEEPAPKAADAKEEIEVEVIDKPAPGKKAEAAEEAKKEEA